MGGHHSLCLSPLDCELLEGRGENNSQLHQTRHATPPTGSFSHLLPVPAFGRRAGHLQNGQERNETKAESTEAPLRRRVQGVPHSPCLCLTSSQGLFWAPWPLPVPRILTSISLSSQYFLFWTPCSVLLCSPQPCTLLAGANSMECCMLMRMVGPVCRKASGQSEYPFFKLVPPMSSGGRGWALELDCGWDMVSGMGPRPLQPSEE